MSSKSPWEKERERRENADYFRNRGLTLGIVGLALFLFVPQIFQYDADDPFREEGTRAFFESLAYLSQVSGVALLSAGIVLSLIAVALERKD